MDEQTDNVLGFSSDQTVDADALRDLADEMEAGKIEAVALVAFGSDRTVWRWFGWNEDSDPWALLGALRYLETLIARELEMRTGDSR